MATTERDLELIQEELRCLRNKFRTTVSTAGGSVSGSLTAPGSSLYPDSFFENCECAGIVVVNPDPIEICPPTENSSAALGELAGVLDDVEELRGIYVFDAVVGVHFRDPVTDTWDTRNVGLSDVTLTHGIVDPWWKSRTDGNASLSAILWTCGDGYVRRSASGGRNGWVDITPTSTVSDLTYLQILGDPYNKKRFYTLGWDETANRAFIFLTTDDGATWSEEELTTFDSATERIPIWMTLSGNGGTSIFLTTWYTNGVTEAIDLLKITNGTLSPLTSFDLGTVTESEYTQRTYIASPATALDDEALLYLYGRMPDPDSLGLSHIVKSGDGGLTFEVVVNDWGTDWAGSLAVGIADTFGTHQYYAVRNTR